jgi:hypothetical protein
MTMALRLLATILAVVVLTNSLTLHASAPDDCASKEKCPGCGAPQEGGQGRNSSNFGH